MLSRCCNLLSFGKIDHLSASSLVGWPAGEPWPQVEGSQGMEAPRAWPELPTTVQLSHNHLGKGVHIWARSTHHLLSIQRGTWSSFLCQATAEGNLRIYPPVGQQVGIRDPAPMLRSAQSSRKSLLRPFPFRLHPLEPPERWTDRAAAGRAMLKNTWQ